MGTRKDELIQALRLALAPMPRLKLAVMFGSRARGDERQDSDLDLAVAFEQPADVLELGEAVSRAEDATGLRVDVVELYGLAAREPALAYGIASEGLLVLDMKDAYWRFRAAAYASFLDAREFLEANRAAFAQSIAKGDLGRPLHA